MQLVWPQMRYFLCHTSLSLCLLADGLDITAEVKGSVLCVIHAHMNAVGLGQQGISLNHIPVDKLTSYKLSY